MDSKKPTFRILDSDGKQYSTGSYRKIKQKIRGAALKDRTLKKTTYPNLAFEYHEKEINDEHSEEKIECEYLEEIMEIDSEYAEEKEIDSFLSRYAKVIQEYLQDLNSEWLHRKQNRKSTRN